MKRLTSILLLAMASLAFAQTAALAEAPIPNCPDCPDPAAPPPPPSLL